MEKGVFSPEEAAAFLGVHPQTIYKLLRNGELPGKKIGQLWRITKSSLIRYLEGDFINPNQNLKPKSDDEPGSLVTPKLWQLVGLLDNELPSNVAEDHDRYLAEILEEESKK